jgi:hypothetical protein
MMLILTLLPKNASHHINYQKISNELLFYSNITSDIQ